MKRSTDRIAERRILDAIEAGEFDNLPGAGQPLVLDDDALVPEGLRAAYRVMKNAGVVPEEVGLRRSIGELEAEIARLPKGESRSRAEQRLAVLHMRMERHGGLRVATGYAARIVSRLSRR